MKKICGILLVMLSAAIFVEPSTARASVEAAAVIESTPSISAGRGYITISTPNDDHSYTFHIFSITGQLIKSVQLRNEAQEIELPQGCFIVKCEKWSKKVIVS